MKYLKDYNTEKRTFISLAAEGFPSAAADGDELIHVDAANSYICYKKIFYNKADGKSTDARIKSFTIGEAEGTIGINTIDVTVPAGTVVTALSPVIELEDANASVDPESEEETDFTDPVEYTVTAENGNTHTYTVTVTVEEE